MTDFDAAHAQVEDAHTQQTPDEERRRRQRRLRRNGGGAPRTGSVLTDPGTQRSFRQAINAGVGNDPLANVDRHTPEERDVLDSRGMASELRSVLQTRLRQVRDQEREHGSSPELQRQAGRLESHILELAAVQNNPAGQRAVTEIANDHQVRIDPRNIRTGVHTQTTNSASMTGTSATATRAREITTVDPSGQSTSRTQSTSVGLSENGVAVTRAHGEGGNSTSTTGSVGFREGTTTVGREQTVTHGDTAQRTSTSVAVSDTQTSVSHGNRTTRTTIDGDSRTVRQSGATGTAGVIYGPNEHGVSAGLNMTSGTTHQRDRAADDFHSREERETTSSSTTTGGGSAQVTDHGAAARGNIAHTETRGPMSYSSRLGANGSFHVDVERVEGSDAYDIVTVVSVGGNAGATVGRGSETGVSVGADVTASHSVTFRHRMSHDEAQRYLAQARSTASGSAHGNQPEFDMMARLRAAGDRQNALRHADIIGDPTAAAGLTPGSSMEVSDQFGATLQGSASAGNAELGASVSASGGGTRNRAVRVRATEVEGHPRVEIRLTFSDGTNRSLSGSVRAMGVAGEAGTATTAENGRVVTVLLDPRSPTYRADFQQVMAAHDLAAAEAVAQRFGAAITRSSSTSNTTSAGAGLAGENGVGTGLTGTSTSAEGTTTALGAVGPNGRRTLDVTTTGSTTQTGNVRVFGTNVATTSDATSATNHVDNQGHQQVDINREQTDSIPVLPEAMQHALGTTHRELEEVRFSDRDVTELARRAGNAYGWQAALTGELLLHARVQWNELGAALRNPRPDPQWVAANPAIANRIARGQAITHFVASVGSQYAHAAFECVTRGGGDDVGRRVEWPDSIADRGRQFTQIENLIDGARAAYAAYQGADRVEHIRRDVATIRGRLQNLLAVVQSCNTFSSSIMKIETEAAITEQLSRLARIERQAIAAPPAAAGAAPATESAREGEGEDEPAPTPQELEAEQRETIHRCINTLTTYKEQERAHWQAAQARIRAASGWFSNPNDCANDAIRELCAVGNMYRTWVRTLHQAYAAIDAIHGTPEALDRLRPNVNWNIQLLNEAAAVAGSIRGMIEDNNHNLIATWREAARLDP